MTDKTCSKCKVGKPTTEFHKHILHQDGLDTQCKTCSLARHKVYRQKNKESRNAYSRVYYQEKYTNDLPYKLMILVQNAAQRVTGKRPRNKEALEILGCTMEHYIQHLESKFTEGMNWDNHAKEGWHIDHIRPLREKELTLEDGLKRLHYTNTQPLWAKDNIAKGNNLEG